MSRFDDWPLVAGSVVGLRAFKVLENRLRSPLHDDSFTYEPGQQPWEARCRDLAFHERYCKSSRYVSSAGCDYWIHHHLVGDPGHGCGFYAWFKPTRPDADTEADTVSAVVEGYGRCTVGDDGFRAQKMRLLGLVRPWECRPWVDPVSDWLAPRLHILPVIGLLWAMMVTAGFMEFQLPLWLALPLLILTVLVFVAAGGMAFMLADHGDHRRHHGRANCQSQRGCRDNPHPYDIEALAQSYGVPLYDTFGDAMKAHPLTIPEDLPNPPTGD